MAATKVRTSIQSAVTSTTTTVGPDLSTGYGATLDLSITNGSTTPTAGAQYQIQVATNYNAGSPALWVNLGGPLVAGVVGSTTYSWSIDLSIGVAAVQVIFTVGTGSGATFAGTADISNVTGI